MSKKYKKNDVKKEYSLTKKGLEAGKEILRNDLKLQLVYLSWSETKEDRLKKLKFLVELMEEKKNA